MIDPTSDALNYVVVSGVRSPGRASISGASIPYEWEVQKAYGMSGGVTIFKGRGIAKFTLTITLWDPLHFVAWEAFAKLLEPPKPGLKLVVEMSYPTLADLGIKAVAVENLGALERQSNGVWTSASSLLEYRPPLPALVKPRGSVPSVDKAAPVPPKTEADRALLEASKSLSDARARASR